jgi:NitT/TauT family transport system ATP-binding protein
MLTHESTVQTSVGQGAKIEVAGISYRYPRAKADVLRGISLTIGAGERVALVGRSGTGKSTLLHLIAGLLQPTSGEVRADGEIVRGPSPRRVMMFQQPSLFPWLTIAENAALGLRFTGRRAGAPQRVAELLALVELGDVADRNVQDLSGGQQQRVALARSLAISPEVLLLDEPFSSLDAFTRRNLQRDVREIAIRLGLTLLVVTHDIDEAVRLADRALVLSANPGRIHAEIGIRDTASGEPLDGARAALVAAYERATGLTIDQSESGGA